MIIIDFVLLFFLLVNLGYSFVLNKRVNELQASKKAFRSIIAELNSYLQKAQKNISDLKSLSEDTKKDLKQSISKAETLVNDLSFMNDMGKDIANRMEKTINEAKEVDRKMKLNLQNESSGLKSTYNKTVKNDIETLISKASKPRTDLPSSDYEKMKKLL